MSEITITSVPIPEGYLRAGERLMAEQYRRQDVSDYPIPFWQRVLAFAALALAVWIAVPLSLFELAGEHD